MRVAPHRHSPDLVRQVLEGAFGEGVVQDRAIRSAEVSPTGSSAAAKCHITCHVQRVRPIQGESALVREVETKGIEPSTPALQSSRGFVVAAPSLSRRGVGLGDEVVLEGDDDELGAVVGTELEHRPTWVFTVARLIVSPSAMSSLLSP